MALFSYAADFTAAVEAPAPAPASGGYVGAAAGDAAAGGLGVRGSRPASSTGPTIAAAAVAASTTATGTASGGAIAEKRVTGDASRGTVYSFLEASLFFSKTAGPLFSGLYAQGRGFVGPLLVSAAMCVILLTFLLLAMPDSPGPGGGRWTKPNYTIPLVVEVRVLSGKF